MKIHYLAVLGAAAAAFVVGGLWYSPLLFGKPYMALRGLDPGGANEMTMSLGEIVGEAARCAVLTFVLARLMAQFGNINLAAALSLGTWIWLGIYTALAGSVLHEGTPWRLYAIHAGDGLAKIVVITIILALWRVP
jgi:hypothetical protein